MSEKTFKELGVPTALVDVLRNQGILAPFPIQTDTLPDSLAGRDVLGRGKTGSGKTLAFSLPIVARLGTKLSGGRPRAGRPLALVLAPTRELATQISATIEPLAEAYNLRITTIYGGVRQTRQVDALKSGVDIIVATPGRLEDLMKQGILRLDAIEITVLDEADHMADLGFLPVVTRLLSATPTQGQRLLFSATLDNGVDILVNKFLHNEVLHSIDEAHSPVNQMTHHVFEVEGQENKRKLIERLASGTSRRILFMRTKHHAKKLALQLTAAGIPSVDLHGNLTQPQRDRNLAAFTEGSVKVLVATDVAARGVHVDDVELVVHVDPPLEHKAYLHRSGRTARAGAQGDVVTICTPAQRQDLSKVLQKAAIDVTPIKVTAASPEVLDLVGEIALYVKPVPKEKPQIGGGKSTGANAQRKRALRESKSREGKQRTTRDGKPVKDRSGRPKANEQGQRRTGAHKSSAGALGRGGRPATARSKSSMKNQGNNSGR